MTRSTAKRVSREQELLPEKFKFNSHDLKQTRTDSCLAEVRIHFIKTQKLPLGDFCIFKTDWVKPHTQSTSSETVNNANADIPASLQASAPIHATDNLKTERFVLERISGHGLDDENRPL